MDAVKYLEVRTEMSNDCKMGCQNCPFDDDNNRRGVDCCTLEAMFPADAVRIAEEWESQNNVECHETDSNGAGINFKAMMDRL